MEEEEEEEKEEEEEMEEEEEEQEEWMKGRLKNRNEMKYEKWKRKSDGEKLDSRALEDPKRPSIKCPKGPAYQHALLARRPTDL